MAGHKVTVTIKSQNQIEGWELSETATDTLFNGMSPEQIVEALMQAVGVVVRESAIRQLALPQIDTFIDANVQRIS